MRWAFLLCLILALGSAGACRTQSAKISKVLPHFQDKSGRHTTAPSLYERDAYQAHLRTHPEEVGGLRFDVEWRSTVYYQEGLKLRLEARGTRAPQILTVEQEIEKRPWYQRWTSFQLDRETFDQLGELIAWRVSLWDGDRELASEQSFLW